MTTTTDTVPLPAAERPRSTRLRFVAALVVALLAVLALGAGALVAYDHQYDGRILPGVRVGSVDISGLTPADARARVAATYASAANGALVLTGAHGSTTIPYADLGRHVDVDGLVADAAAVGRAGGPLDRLIGGAKTALRGVVVAPRVVFDEAELEARVRDAARSLEIAPVDAAVTTTATGFEVTPGRDGEAADAAGPYAAAASALSAFDAPARIEVPITTVTAPPQVSTDEATAAKASAELIAQDISLVDGKEHWTIPSATIRSWIVIAPTADGGYAPIPDTARMTAAITKLSASVLRKPVNATFLVGKGAAVVGVTASRTGRKLDVAATTTALANALTARGANVPTPEVPAAMTLTQPALTTEQAQKAAPLMRRISTWTTWFPISDHNHFGANIWLPAQFINGTVVAPGETFDFWKTVGPVTAARGFGKGGAIIDGKTDPQGAIGGGICSCSTTLFNAALRAGMEIKARRNHFYYIDRYPLGLDATVFISNGGSVQTMSWRNDTRFPVLIRGIRTRSGNRGFVRFDLYSVPNGRKVVLSAPVVKNVTHATDSVQYTSSMPKGTSKRIEYPVDGKDVWRTVTVYQDGKLLRQHTYYSHYTRITGILLIGTGGSSSGDTTGSTPKPTPKPTP
ncbi:MAG TPA: VanW family protein [Candidatus Limnocylindrales bacterium]